MLTAGAVRDRRCGQPGQVAVVGQACRDRVGDRCRDPGVGVQRQVRPVLFGGANGYREPYRHALQLARRRAPEVGLDYHSVMVRRIHLSCIGCWRSRKKFSRRSFTRTGHHRHVCHVSINIPAGLAPAAGYAPPVAGEAAPSVRVKPSGTSTSSRLRSCTDARPRPIKAESIPPCRMSSTFSTPGCPAAARPHR